MASSDTKNASHQMRNEMAELRRELGRSTRIKIAAIIAPAAAVWLIFYLPAVL